MAEFNYECLFILNFKLKTDMCPQEAVVSEMPKESWINFLRCASVLM